MAILKNTFLASVGIYNLTRTKAEQIVDSLIKAGEISQSDRTQAIIELLDKAEVGTRKMKEKILAEASEAKKEAGEMLGKLKKSAGTVTQKKILAEIDGLKKKLDNLAREVKKRK